MRVALVGLGEIGLAAHLPALLRRPDVDVVQLVDPDPGRREIAAGQGIPARAELDPHAVDGVVLATPPWVTPELAVRSARAGLFVLAEKPIATSVEAARIYDQLDDEQRRRIQVGLTYRHDPAVRQLRTWIAAGTLGTPVLVRAHIYDEAHRPEDHEHTERITATLEHGTPVVHEGAHLFDWLSHLLGGQPQRVQDAWSSTTRPELPAPNLIGARLTYPNGHQALVEFGWFTTALPRCELTFLGDRGLATLDGFTFDLRLSTADGDRELRFPGDRTTRCFDLQVQRFVELYDSTRKAGEPSLDDGIAALRTAQLVAGRAT
ncbi:putative dehydrogenase [Kribbella sp. VKM Ac-2571]|uniref:Gfo/Idh/MocA family protein n=1 Tax=Kribbella sp. VKM Ac-2571 TaxID=2512222 RepID=UPI00105BE104|nr:Gfo/Idh/MocA family oxidoreductase [Kribbella sp. VKM Ac-2571]TDO69508.1 putative dehydrogenase [Kribbella sp. VKM Ac-2571]